MATECTPDIFGFEAVEGRAVVAAFDGGAITSDAGALLLGATDRVIRMVDRLASCFVDRRSQAQVEHSVATLVGQRIIGIALGYEDLNDHETLRHDPLMAVLAGKLEARRADCAAVAGKSTLNRLELSKPEPSRYHKISYDAAAMDKLFVDLFLEAHRTAPREITLDLDATDDPLHGEQEGRFFHGYYKSYCYLPLYIFCGRHLLCAKLRRANIDASAGSVEEVARIVAQIRERWPEVRILLRADSGFTRDDLMTWCEQNDVDYLFGLAKNDRLIAEIAAELAEAAEENRQSGKPARRFKDFDYRTHKSWSRQRRVVGKAEWMIPSAAESESTMKPPAQEEEQEIRHGRRHRPGDIGRPGQSALRRHLAAGQPASGPRALREALLRPRRDGKPYQRMSARYVRRQDFHPHHARQPVAALAVFNGLCPCQRATPHRSRHDPLR